MKNILVTGVTGCTGRGVLHYLKSKNYENIFGLTRKEPEEPIEEVHYLIGDLVDSSTYYSYFEKNTFDTIFHIAAAVHRTKIENFYKVNILGTNELLNIAIRNKVSNFVYVSTTGVYGKILQTPATEKHRTKPWGMYSLSKKITENTVIDKCTKNQISGGILRAPLILGKHDRHFYPIVKKLLLWNIIPILGDPEHKISVVHPYDIGQALEILSNQKKGDFDVYNIVSEDIRFRELLLELEQELIGKKRFKYYLPYPLAFLGAWALEAIYGALTPNKDPLFNREYAQMVGREWTFSIEKIKRLGYTPQMEKKDIISDLTSEKIYPITQQ